MNNYFYAFIIASLTATDTMAAFTYDPEHSAKPHHQIENRQSMHQAGFMHIRAAKYFQKKEHKDCSKKDHEKYKQDSLPDFRVMNKGPLPPLQR